MNSANMNTFGMFRTSILTIVAALLISFLLQLDFPTAQQMRDNLTSTWVERQMGLTGQNSGSLIQQGWTYYQLGRFTKAKILMEKAYADEKNISALYCLGLIDLKYRRIDDGIAKLEKVTASSPDHVPTMMVLGEAYFQKRFFGRSRTLFEKAVECEPTDAKARLWLGRTYLRLNETAKARQVLGTVNSGPEAQDAALLLKNI